MTNPAYYAVIPANVRYDKNLSPIEVLLYSELTALNNYQEFNKISDLNLFMKSNGFREPEIKKHLESLQNNGYIDLKSDYSFCLK